MRQKFVFIQLGGGMDGLAALRPDNHEILKTKRPGLLGDGYLKTQSGFAFHPKLSTLHQLFENGELSFLNACGLPIQDRSHFKSQDMLETGKLTPIARSGWLAEILNSMSDGSEAVCYGHRAPLIVKGTKHCFNWSSPTVLQEDYNLTRAFKDLYQDTPTLKDIPQKLTRIEDLLGGFSARGKREDRFEIIGKMLSRHDGPNIGVIRFGNWDTHDSQTTRLDKLFSGLDNGVSTLRTLMKHVWDNTIVIIASEFGRTIGANGTKGTDHGTGGLSFVLGGAVAGGHSLGSWPGLAEKDLFEGRDLMPVHDIRLLFAHIASQHFGLENAFIENQLFPDLPKTYDSLDFIRSRNFV